MKTYQIGLFPSLTSPTAIAVANSRHIIYFHKMKNYFFLLLIGFLLVSCSTDEEKAEEAFEEAKWYLERHDPLGAHNYLADAVKLNPNESVYWFELGNARLVLNDYKSAIEFYTEAIELKPNYHIYWYKRALSRKRIGDYEGAMNDFTEAIELNPKSSDSWNQRGNLHYELNNYSSAINDYAKAIEIEPTNAIYFSNRANARMLFNDKEGACADARVAEQLGEDIDISKYCD